MNNCGDHQHFEYKKQQTVINFDNFDVLKRKLKKKL